MDLLGILGVAAAPLVAALLFGVIGSGIRLAIARYMQDGWLKRQILAERFKSQSSRATAAIAAEAAKHPNGWRGFIKKKPVVINDQATLLRQEVTRQAGPE